MALATTFKAGRVGGRVAGGRRRAGVFSSTPYRESAHGSPSGAGSSGLSDSLLPGGRWLSISRRRPPSTDETPNLGVFHQAVERQPNALIDGRCRRRHAFAAFVGNRDELLVQHRITLPQPVHHRE